MTTKKLLNDAVVNSTSLAGKNLLDRLFTAWFDRLVYPQIWEDPAVDAKGLKITENSRIFCIASGSCNIFNYLTYRPASITAVDLNAAHVALFHLKKSALDHLPDHDAFFDFFGHADKKVNYDRYMVYLRPYLDPATIAYWEGRDRFKKRMRIEYFTKGFYRYGLLGEFIGFAHKIAKLYGLDPAKVMKAKNRDDRVRLFDKHIAPFFDKRAIKFLSDNAVTLYSLGIPPSQFEKMAEESGGKMHKLLKERMRKLICDFDLSDNYFAWQACTRGYDTKHCEAIPDYLRKSFYTTLQECSNRCTVDHISMTDKLATMPDESLDAYTFLDAQDWMDDAALNALWQETTRTAAPGARVIFRTAGTHDILPGRLEPRIAEQWHCDTALSAELTEEDRSAIYGACWLYIKQ